MLLCGCKDDSGGYQGVVIFIKLQQCSDFFAGHYEGVLDNSYHITMLLLGYYK